MRKPRDVHDIMSRHAQNANDFFSKISANELVELREISRSADGRIDWGLLVYNAAVYGFVNGYEARLKEEKKKPPKARQR